TPSIGGLQPKSYNNLLPRPFPIPPRPGRKQPPLGAAANPPPRTSGRFGWRGRTSPLRTGAHTYRVRRVPPPAAAPIVSPFSVLDLAPITEGSDAGQALRNSLDLARHAERWGYHRFWLAEHHSMPGIASAATSVVIGYVAGGTSTIRVGSGGVMLPNHAPLVIAEQFGTLASLYPGRIDLGLGRAPGTDPRTSQALRRDVNAAAERFPQDVQELQAYFQPAAPGQPVRAVPGAGLDVPIWIL